MTIVVTDKEDLFIADDHNIVIGLYGDIFSGDPVYLYEWLKTEFNSDGNIDLIIDNDSATVSALVVVKALHNDIKSIRVLKEDMLVDASEVLSIIRE